MGASAVPSGVCSIQITPGSQPWIVCPRRLLVLGKKDRPGNREHQLFVDEMVLRLSPFEKSTQVGVWSEVKLQHSMEVEGISKSFDYTFDYVLFPLNMLSQYEAEDLYKTPWKRIRTLLTRAGYEVCDIDGAEFVADFPDTRGVPFIIEIMTSSTSGGNQKRRSTIPMAFEDAIKQQPHVAPGINYRQVWARMVSQLIVKSQVGIGWGGRTLWVLQDVLVDYISGSTALNMQRFTSQQPAEVNVLAISYGNQINADGVIALSESKLYSGPISSVANSEDQDLAFQDIIKAPYQPPIQKLFEVLRINTPLAKMTIP